MKNYRPEIDGLRALAVLSVIIYHGELSLYNFKLLEGGFLGVDVFFVVSGYLITSLILNDINLKGKFSYLYFYERRARRILPALLIIILTFLPISYFLLLPNEFEEFSKSILYTLGFGSNFYFYYSGLIYGAENGLLKPLLHTWSLSVEEQYYLIFPIIILLFIKLFKNKIIYVILFCLFFSLIYAHWNAFHNPSLNFYSLLSRGWELLAGSLLAFLETKYNRNLSNKYLKTIFPWYSFYKGTQECFINKEEHIAGCYGIENRYPFLDKIVVQEFLHLSPKLKNQFYKAPLYYTLKKLNFPFDLNKKLGFSIK